MERHQTHQTQIFSQKFQATNQPWALWQIPFFMLRNGETGLLYDLKVKKIIEEQLLD